MAIALSYDCPVIAWRMPWPLDRLSDGTEDRLQQSESSACKNFSRITWKGSCIISLKTSRLAKFPSPPGWQCKILASLGWRGQGRCRGLQLFKFVQKNNYLTCIELGWHRFCRSRIGGGQCSVSVTSVTSRKTCYCDINDWPSALLAAQSLKMAGDGCGIE